MYGFHFFPECQPRTPVGAVIRIHRSVVPPPFQYHGCVSGLLCETNEDDIALDTG